MQGGIDSRGGGNFLRKLINGAVLLSWGGNFPGNKHTMRNVTAHHVLKVKYLLRNYKRNKNKVCKLPTLKRIINGGRLLTLANLKAPRFFF